MENNFLRDATAKQRVEYMELLQEELDNFFDQIWKKYTQGRRKVWERPRGKTHLRLVEGLKRLWLGNIQLSDWEEAFREPPVEEMMDLVSVKLMGDRIEDYFKKFFSRLMDGMKLCKI